MDDLNKKEVKDEKKNVFEQFPFSLKPDLSLFEKATDEEKAQQERMRESSSFFRDGIRRLRKNVIAMICLGIIVVITLIAFIVPTFYPYQYQETTAGNSYSEGFLSPFQYSIREQILRVKSEDVVFMGWSKVNEETFSIKGYGGLQVIDSEEYLESVSQYFVTEPLVFDSSSIELYAVWGIDKNHDGIADFGSEYFSHVDSQSTKAKRYHITYDANGGINDVPVDETEYAAKDKVVPIHENIALAKEAAIFVGWSENPLETLTKENYESLSQNIKKSITIGKTDITLYAVWAIDEDLDGVADGFKPTVTYSTSTKIKRYKVVYNKNFGEGEDIVDTTEYAASDSFVPTMDVSLTKQYKNIFPHILGTDMFGRDYAIRIIVGTRVSLLVGIIAAVMVVLIGVLYGAISGYLGGKVDMVMMRIVDIIYSLPDTLIIILFSVSIGEVIKSSSFAATASKLGGTGMVSILIVFAMLYWVGMARLVRGQVLTLREQEYVLAAKSIGASPMRIILKHMLPNCISVIFISAALQIPSAIFTESTLSFLGVGVSVPMPSLGSLASDGRGYMSIASQRFLFLIPAVVIFLIVLSLNLLGQGLRDAFDPKLRTSGGK